MLKEVPLTLFTTEQLIPFSDRVVKLTTPPMDAILAKRLERVDGANKVLTISYKKGTKSHFTPILSIKDADRDDGYKCIKFGVLSASNSLNPVKRAAGKRVLEVLKKHNTTLYNLSYVSQSSEMKSLKLDLEEYKDDIATIGLTEDYEAMKTAMEDFEKVYKEKTEVESAEDTPNTREAKRLLIKELILLFRQVQILEEDEELGIDTLVTKYNELISNTLKVIRAQQTRKENNSESKDSE